VSGAVLDDLALAAGLAGTGTEHERHRMSWRLHTATQASGPSLILPALCLAAVTGIRPAVADHIAALVASAPAGTLPIAGLIRSTQLDAVRDTFPALSWAGIHAVSCALDADVPLITNRPKDYTGIPLPIIPL
jgi:hypothetical protein